LANQTTNLKAGLKIVVLENLSMGLANIVFHMHKVWPTLMQDLIGQLSGTI